MKYPPKNEGAHRLRIAFVGTHRETLGLVTQVVWADFPRPVATLSDYDALTKWVTEEHPHLRSIVVTAAIEVEK